MLFKTIHKVAAATTLWVMALLGASLANAQINLDDKSPKGVVYSLEGLASNADLAVAGTANKGYYVISASSSRLNVSKKLEALAAYRLGQSDPSPNDIWVRVEAKGSLKIIDDTTLTVNDTTAPACYVGVMADSVLSEEGFRIYKIDPDEGDFASVTECTDASPFPAGDVTLTVPLGRRRDGATININADPPENVIEGPMEATTAIKPGAGILHISVYDSASGAYDGDSDAMLFEEEFPVTSTASSLDVSFSAGMQAVSDVETGFTRFVGTSEAMTKMATLGSVTVKAKTAAATHWMPNGEIAANKVPDLIGGESKVRIMSDSDFSFATFALGGVGLMPIALDGNTLSMGTGASAAALNATCSNPNPEGAEANTRAMMDACEVALVGMTPQMLTATVIESTAEDFEPLVIPEASFTAMVMFDDESTAVSGNLPDDTDAMPVGSIRQNGSTFQLPMVTTFEGYNNRIFIVNRSKRDASYSMEFTTEDGVTATEGSAATGTVEAGTTAVIRAMDAVSLEGGMRTAATLFVVGAPGNTDVLTQIVNKSDGSTDTLRYEADQVR